MPRYIPYPSPDELYHWGLFKKGDKAKNHKYVMRLVDGVKSNGLPNYLYFYTMKEYNDYMNKKNGVKKDYSMDPVKSTTKSTTTTTATATASDDDDDSSSSSKSGSSGGSGGSSKGSSKSSKSSKSTTDKYEEWNDLMDAIVNGEYGDDDSEIQSKLKESGYDLVFVNSLMSSYSKKGYIDSKSYKKAKRKQSNANIKKALKKSSKKK